MCCIYASTEKRSYPPRSYTSDEALDEVFRLLTEETNNTNDENRDLDELDFTVEESKGVDQKTEPKQWKRTVNEQAVGKTYLS